MKLGLGVETLRFLLPADVLPGEDDMPLKVPVGRAPDLFGCVDQLVTKPLLACRFAKSDASKFEIFTGESEVTLESVLLRPQADDGGTVCIDGSSALPPRMKFPGEACASWPPRLCYLASVRRLLQRQLRALALKASGPLKNRAPQNSGNQLCRI